MAKTITQKSANNRTFSISKVAQDKLLKLRNYHNKSYNNLIEILIENAYCQMSEAVNIDKTKELEKQKQQVDFQVQQLTLMFGNLKSEFESVKAENFILREKTEAAVKKSVEISNLVSTSSKELQTQIDSIKQTVESNNSDLSKGLKRHSERFVEYKKLIDDLEERKSNKFIRS